MQAPPLLLLLPRPPIQAAHRMGRLRGAATPHHHHHPALLQATTLLSSSPQITGPRRCTWCSGACWGESTLLALSARPPARLPARTRLPARLPDLPTCSLAAGCPPAPAHLAPPCTCPQRDLALLPAQLCANGGAAPAARRGRGEESGVRCAGRGGPWRPAPACILRESRLHVGTSQGSKTSTARLLHSAEPLLHAPATLPQVVGFVPTGWLFEMKKQLFSGGWVQLGSGKARP